MIGVDVVDLTDPLLKDRTGKEFRFISHPEDTLNTDTAYSARQLFWIFWAAKEAVFKAHRLASAFAPKDIQIKLSPLTEGELAFEGCWQIKSEGKVFFNATEVLAIAATGPLRQVCFARYKISTNNHSAEVRTMLGADLPDGWKIGTGTSRLPVLSSGGKEEVPVSFSHHHQLGACAWLKLADGIE